MTDPVLPALELYDDELEMDDRPRTQLQRAPATPASEPIRVGDRPQVWFLIGEGGSGKTVEARWLVWRMLQSGRAPPVIAALDPGYRALAEWFTDVMQPPGKDTAGSGRWLVRFLEQLCKEPTAAILDFGGGGEAALLQVPGLGHLVDILWEAGLAAVGAYTLTPRLAGLSSMRFMEAAGFRPRARALLLNEGRADPTLPREQAFSGVLRHSVFRNGVASGAQPVWMPRLDSETMLEMERRRLTFDQARDGLVPEGSVEAPIGGLRRRWVGDWLLGMETAHLLLAGAGWLP